MEERAIRVDTSIRKSIIIFEERNAILDNAFRYLCRYLDAVSLINTFSYLISVRTLSLFSILIAFFEDEHPPKAINIEINIHMYIIFLISRYTFDERFDTLYMKSGYCRFAFLAKKKL